MSYIMSYISCFGVGQIRSIQRNTSWSRMWTPLRLALEVGVDLVALILKVPVSKGGGGGAVKCRMKSVNNCSCKMSRTPSAVCPRELLLL